MSVVKYKEENTRIVETDELRMEFEEWTGEVVIFDKTDGNHIVFMDKMSKLKEISMMLSKLISVKE